MKPWNTAEIAYMEAHAHEGAREIAAALGRTPHAVRVQASRYGISLMRLWFCPRCATWVHKPTNARTGYCAACSMESRANAVRSDARAMAEQARREADAKRAIDAAYQERSRARKKLREIRDRGDK